MGKKEEAWVLDDLRGTTGCCGRSYAFGLSYTHCVSPWADHCSLTQPSARSGHWVDPHSLSKCTVPIGARGDSSLTLSARCSHHHPLQAPCLCVSLHWFHSFTILPSYFILWFFFPQHLHCWHRSFLFPVPLWIYIFIGAYQSHWDRSECLSKLHFTPFRADRQMDE